MSEYKTITTELYLSLEDDNSDDYEHILAHLLAKHVLFINNGWWLKEDNVSWPEDSITIHVNCNDIFAWGCADSEIGELYKMWKKDNDWGPAAWCIQQRKQMPQKPVEDILRKAGIWNVDNLVKGGY